MAGKFSNVLAKWIGNTGQKSDTAYATLQEEMKKMFEQLGDYLGDMTNDRDVAAACVDAGQKYQSNGRIQDKEICKALVRALYWMNRRGRWSAGAKGKDEAGGESLKELNQYLRCIVGYSAMVRLLSNKRDVEKIVETVQKAAAEPVKGGGAGGEKGTLNEKCNWVTYEDISLGTQILGKPLAEWVQNLNSKAGIMSLYLTWTLRDQGTGTERQEIDENKDQKKGVMELLGEKKAASLQEKVVAGVPTSPPAGAASPEGKLQQFLQNAESCKAEDSNNVQNCLKKKLELAVGGSECKSSSSFCSRLECVLKKKKGLDGSSTGKTTNDDEVRGAVKTEVTSFDSALSTSAGNANDIDTLCNGITCPNDNANDCVSKTTCKIMAKALKNIHQIKKENGSPSKGDGENDRIFRSTIRCVALNAFIHKLKEQANEGGYVCAVEEGITEAFEVGGTQRSTWCKGSGNEKGSCEECGKDHQCVSTDVGGIKPWEEVMKELNNESNTKVKSTLEGLHSQATLCDRLHCAINQWKKTKGTPQTQINDEEFWTTNVKNLWDELAKKMKETNGKVNGQCDSFETEAEEAACKYLHAGLEHLYNTTTTSSSSGTANSEVLDNPSFRQTMGCFLLHSYAKYMQSKATCNIEKGITQAFESWNRSTTGKCNNGSCVPCKWADNAQLDSCNVPAGTGGNTSLTENVMKKLEMFVNEKDSNISAMLTKINKRDNLCDHMKCIATHLNSSTGQQQQQPSNTTANEFWEKSVKKLWEDLAEAMMHTNGNGTGTECNGFDNPSAERACNYLHAGFEKLKSISSSTATNGGDYPILSKDSSFVQTVGCFLLHSYAEHMEKKSTCVITAGIKQAFDTAGTNGISVPCQWNDDDYDTCRIITNGGSGSTTPTKVKPKVKGMVEGNDPDTDSIIKNINEMKTLCDGLKCIASHLNSPNAQKNFPNVTQFWESGGEVGQLWTELSEAMLQNVDKDNGGPCRTMDDGSATGSGAANGTRPATKPEKKACNYLHAGFNRLKENLTQDATKYPILSQHPSLRQTMGCFLLKEYAKQMQGKSTCLIESGIKKAFKVGGAVLKGTCNGGASGTEPCVPCQWKEKDYDNCQITTNGNAQTKVTQKLTLVKDKIDGTATTTMEQVNKMTSLCQQLQCAASNWFKNHSNVNSGTPTKKDWNEISGVVEAELRNLLEEMSKKNDDSTFNQYCNDVGSPTNDTKGEITAKQKACRLFASGLKHISDIKKDKGQDPDVPLIKTMMCAALNLYADELISKSTDQCPLDGTKLGQAIKHAFGKSNDIMGNKTASSCSVGTNDPNSCFICERQNPFSPCKIGSDEIKSNMTELIKENDKTNTTNNRTDPNNSTPNMEKTLDKINSKDTFCTQVQCAIKQHYNKNKNKNGQAGVMATPNWSEIENDAKGELSKLLGHMLQPSEQNAVTQYCQDYDWYTLGHKQSKTNKAACLLFASGLKHIYNHGNGRVKSPVKGPSFGQTMGCLFLKEYAKQLIDLADKEKKHKVHPKCSVEDGINYAFGKSNAIMNATPPCDKSSNSCFECKLNDYEDCKIGTANVKDKVKSLLQSEQNLMEETLSNTLCPILPMDLLTPFLPLAPVSIGLSAMAYYLWKYFGPLGKGGPRFRRSPAEIRGPSVQEQVLDHVDAGASHEYRLVKERKPPSAPTRTKRSAGVNRRTIIEIHFEVLDECQKGDTQLNQKDFLELLVQEFMGSEFMEEKQVPKEEVLMEGVPMESIPLEQVPMERVPSLGSGFMV
ncbi:SICAvar, type I [Plasmodium knowlesi strain H]|uniref:SICAvar, type I n=3 Tax=Plasmodium knowlesi TaxID=5850 RepID=A0A679KUV3_PLAKH|nr:SICAvar, type I [Plasmodium knowlesi strain H]OTN68609.1 SICAvar type I [Plasmodium knowlesi]CAA9986642.1 SICAvar, type I [Plasmodium knowlesi strain H]VVS76116.1 SICAvar, type I [Plasmodium knowlesi strain H]